MLLGLSKLVTTIRKLRGCEKSDFSLIFQDFGLSNGENIVKNQFSRRLVAKSAEPNSKILIGGLPEDHF